jgi:carbamoyltransferase
VNILGISAFYHDSAAALVQDGALVAAAQEERFTRKKHDPAFPANAIAFCLQRGGVDADGIDAVVYYDKPITTFVRLLRTYLRVGPKGIRSFLHAMPTWTREKLWISYEIEKGLDRLGYRTPKKLWFTEHHESHAASAFFPSPFESAAILTFDGVGEWATSSIGVGRGNRISIERQLTFPNSLGLLYSAFTYFCGFRVNSGEYKLMGLAPYGQPTYVKRIVTDLIDLRPDGSFRMDMRSFNYLSGLTMTNRRFADLFGGPPRSPESEITQRELDLAASIQVVTEEIVMRMARHAAETTGERNAVLAGGVALNCVANGKLLRDGPFDRIWIQPAAGDAGGAVGAAYYGWHQVLDNPRRADGVHDAMQGAYLGPQFASDEIAAWLDANGYPYERLSGKARARRVAACMARGEVVGMLQGRMEFGPRALGHRSIIGDPRSSSMQSTMNLKIKYRESFRPFAPAVLDDQASKVFEIEPGIESPYMLLVAGVRPELRTVPDAEPARSADLRTWVNEVRSTLPAITHVDYSARLQTVAPDTSPQFHAVIEAFDELTGCPVVINTSFNVRGEPIVCTPEDAYRCFMRTEMDTLVLEDCILSKGDQPEFADAGGWQHDFVLD